MARLRTLRALPFCVPRFDSLEAAWETPQDAYHPLGPFTLEQVMMFFWRVKTWRVAATRSTTTSEGEIWPTENFNIISHDAVALDNERAMICAGQRLLRGQHTIVSTSSAPFSRTLEATARLTLDFREGNIFRVGDGYYFKQSSAFFSIDEHGLTVPDFVQARTQYVASSAYAPGDPGTLLLDGKTFPIFTVHETGTFPAAISSSLTIEPSEWWEYRRSDDTFPLYHAASGERTPHWPDAGYRGT